MCTATVHRTRTLDLGHEQMLVIEDRPGTRVDVLLGGVWLTEERCWEDRYAAAGEWLRIEARGRAIVEAIGPTRVALAEPRERFGALGRLTRALRSPAALLMPQLAAAFAAIALGFGVPELLGRSAVASGTAAEAGSACAIAAQGIAPAPPRWAAPRRG